MPALCGWLPILIRCNRCGPAGTVVEKTFRAGETVNGADISTREGQFTYAEGDEYVFMVRPCMHCMGSGLAGGVAAEQLRRKEARINWRARAQDCLLLVSLWLTQKGACANGGSDTAETINRQIGWCWELTSAASR